MTAHLPRVCVSVYGLEASDDLANASAPNSRSAGCLSYGGGASLAARCSSSETCRSMLKNTNSEVLRATAAASSATGSASSGRSVVEAPKGVPRLRFLNLHGTFDPTARVDAQIQAEPSSRSTSKDAATSGDICIVQDSCVQCAEVESTLNTPVEAIASRFETSSSRWPQSDDIAEMRFRDEICAAAAAGDVLVVADAGLGLMDGALIELLNRVGSIDNLLVLALNIKTDVVVLNNLCDVEIHNLPDTRRQRAYARGGIYLATASKLILDLLPSEVLLPSGDQKTLLLIADAHCTTRELSEEAFVVRLLKRKRPSAKVVGLSENANAFLHGFSNLKNSLMSMHIKETKLYPRFRDDVARGLSSRARPVDFIRVSLSEKSKLIQNGLMDLISQAVERLKTHLKDDRVDAASALYERGDFDSAVGGLISNISSTKRFEISSLHSDVKNFRRLLLKLTSRDCVKFFDSVQSVWGEAAAGWPKKKIKKTTSRAHLARDWLSSQAADGVFAAAKSRVCRVSGRTASAILERSPKVERTVALANASPHDVLIVCAENSTSWEVARTLVVSKTKDRSLDHKLIEFAKWLSEKIAADDRRAAESVSHVPRDETVALRELYATKVAPARANAFGSREAGVSCARVINASALTTTGGLQRLKDYAPAHVICHDPDLVLLRVLEVYSADAVAPPKISSLVYSSTLEELRYKHALHDDSFKCLIEERAHVVIPAFGTPSRDPQADVAAVKRARKTALETGLTAAQNPDVSTPYTRLPSSADNSDIVVDAREFRATLLNVLDAHAFQLDARTLEVGDYVLAPEICIERKTVPDDLFSSLINNRLLKQVSSMSKAYPRGHYLLLEFFKRRFRLVERYDEDDDDIIPRMLMLLIDHPNLRLLWSHSHEITVRLFKDLKKNRPPPCGQIASNMRSLEDNGVRAEQTGIANETGLEMLRRMPGVSEFTVHTLASHCGSIKRLCTETTKVEMVSLLSSEKDAQKLWDFLHGGARA